MKKLLFYLLNLLVTISLQAGTIDSLKGVLYSHPVHDTIRVNLFLKIAKSYIKGEHDSLFYYASHAKNTAEKLKYAHGINMSNNLLSMYYYYAGEIDSAAKLVNEMLEQALLGHDTGQLLKCYSRLGVLNRLMGNDELAFEEWKTGLIYVDSVNPQPFSARLYSNIGIYYGAHADYVNALKYYQKGLRLDEKQNNRNAMADDYNNIGNMYSETSDFKLALDYFNKAYAIYDKLEDVQGLARACNNKGVAFYRQENYDSAGYYYANAMKIMKENNQFIAPSYYINVGNTYFSEDNFDKALEYYLKARSVAIKNNIMANTDALEQNISMAYSEKGDYKNAVKYSKYTLESAKRMKHQKRVMSAYENMALLYSKLHVYKEAYNNYVLFKKLSDSLFNKKSIQKLAVLETKFKFEKEREAIHQKQLHKEIIAQQKLEKQWMFIFILSASVIVILIVLLLILRNNKIKRRANLLLREKNETIVRQNVEINEKDQKLEEANRTKDKFFTIIAHDLKSPLASLISLSEVMASNPELFEKDEMARLIKTFNKSLQTTYQLMENLLTWARNQSDSISFIPKDYDMVEMLKQNIDIYRERASQKGIRLHYEFEIDSCKVFCDINMMNTVIRNLLSNAIKFTSDGEISVSVRRVGEMCEFAVSDTGIGIEPKDMGNLFDLTKVKSRPGTLGEEGTGLGLILSETFVEKNGGEIKVKSTPGKGTSFIVSVPLSKK